MDLDIDNVTSEESIDDLDAEPASDHEGDAPVETEASREVSVDEDRVVEGLGQLVLALVNLIHELLEKQAIRRMESGQLTDDEVERLGRTLMEQAQEIERLCDEFDLDEEDLNLDLGPLGEMV